MVAYPKQCGNGKLYPHCGVCPNTNETSLDGWCNGIDCYYDQNEDLCKEKGKMWKNE